MVQVTDKLPDDVASLQMLLIAERSTTQRLQQQLDGLFESLHLARHKNFGATSEKAPGQGELIDEAENESDNTEESEASEPVGAEPAKAKTPRPTRKPLPASIPRIRNVIELPEQERT